MCGIIGVHVRSQPDKVRERLFAIYTSQKHRGYNGFGYAVQRSGRITRKRYSRENNLFSGGRFKRKLAVGDMAIIHHRLPTTTANLPECNHPIADEQEQVFLIHNGHIVQAEEIGERLAKQGHSFETQLTRQTLLRTRSKTYEEGSADSFTDSEVLVHYLEEDIGQGSFKKALGTILERVHGSYALAWLQNGDEQIHLLSHSNPVVIFEDEDKNVYFASEYPETEGFRLVRRMAENEYGVVDGTGYSKVHTFKSEHMAARDWQQTFPGVIDHREHDVSVFELRDRVCELVGDWLHTVRRAVLSGEDADGLDMSLSDISEAITEEIVSAAYWQNGCVDPLDWWG